MLDFGLRRVIVGMPRPTQPPASAAPNPNNSLCSINSEKNGGNGIPILHLQSWTWKTWQGGPSLRIMAARSLDIEGSRLKSCESKVLQGGSSPGYISLCDKRAG
jgi:hypothetical protein